MFLLPFLLVLNPVLQVLHLTTDLLVGVDRVDLLANSVEKGQGRALRAHQNLRPHAHRHGVWNEGFREDGLPEPIVAFVGHYADDYQRLLASGGRKCKRRFTLHLGDFQKVTEGTVRKIEASHGCIEYGNVGTSVVLSFVPKTALDQWNSQDRKISWTDEIDTHFLFVFCRSTRELNRRAPAVGRRRGIGGDCGHGDAGESGR